MARLILRTLRQSGIQVYVRLMPDQLPPANWYPDPNAPNQLRCWDGTSWTEHRTPVPTSVASVAVPPAATAQPVASDRANGTSTAKATLGAFAQGFLNRRERRIKLAVSEPTISAMLSDLQLEKPRHPLDEQVEVAGETFHVKGIKRVFAEAGLPISRKGSTLDSIECILVPEPWNPHDQNAVAVAVGNHQVGYLPADLAIDYSAALLVLATNGYLASGEARIWAKADSGVVRARVTLLIPEATAF